MACGHAIAGRFLGKLHNAAAPAWDRVYAATGPRGLEAPDSGARLPRIRADSRMLPAA